MTLRFIAGSGLNPDAHNSLIEQRAVHECLRPEPTHAPCVLTGLGDVALVDTYGKQVGRFGEHLHL